MTKSDNGETFKMNKGTIAFLALTVTILLAVAAGAGNFMQSEEKIGNLQEDVQDCKNKQNKLENQINENDKNVAVIKSQLQEVNQKLDKIQKSFDSLEKRLK